MACIFRMHGSKMEERYMNRKFPVAMALVLLIALPPALAMARPFHDTELDMRVAKERGVVLNPGLADRLEDMEPGDGVGVIVQFDDGPTDPDLRFMRAIGMDVKRTFRAIPGVYAEGSKDSVVRLADYDRTHWMEFNKKMEPLMNGTTTVVNATKVWQSLPMNIRGQMDDPIDGTGVTVAVVDTGIDAGHPDLDYGEKVIINLKSDMDGTFTEVEDGDTGSGHGTHCAGTIAGNGDASAGARRGVAPGAKLVGISTGEYFLQNVIGALEWVYEHSRPHNNPYNIRVVSNSWGSGADYYDPNNAVTIIANKITYENNVVVVFAAGNSGENNHDGSEITTSIYGNTPSIIQVAASLHDGNGLAYFSSRGKAGENETWPDIAAPGYHIWATQARKTQITAIVSANNPADAMDAYYMSISGTSMATPHVSGAVALLWQAAPSMRVMELSDDSTTEEPAYWNNSETRIHEAEWILEATSNYMPPHGENGIPENHSISDTHFHHRYDFAQGYGLINMEKAVQVALTLEELRRKDPTTQVYEAYTRVMNNSEYPDGLNHIVNVTEETNTIQTEWIGEWGYLLDTRNEIVTHHARKVYIPNGTKVVTVDLNYNPATSESWSIGQLTVRIDSNQDGTIDWTGQSGYSAHGWKTDEVPVSTIGDTDAVWDVHVTGEYLVAPGKERPNLLNNQYNEVLVEYTLGMKLLLETSEDNTTYIPMVDRHAAYAKWDFGDPEIDGEGVNGSITMSRYVYNMSRMEVEEKGPQEPDEEPGFPWWLLGVVLMVGLLAFGYNYARKKGIGPFGKGEAKGGSEKGVADAGSKSGSGATGEKGGTGKGKDKGSGTSATKKIKEEAGEVVTTVEELDEEERTMDDAVMEVSEEPPPDVDLEKDKKD